MITLLMLVRIRSPIAGKSHVTQLVLCLATQGLKTKNYRAKIYRLLACGWSQDAIACFTLSRNRNKSKVRMWFVCLPTYIRSFLNVVYLQYCFSLFFLVSLSKFKSGMHCKWQQFAIPYAYVTRNLLAVL